MLVLLLPGSIHEGGELGYSLVHAYGAVLDNPDLIAVCVVGDGESETGPLATSWQSNKFINPKRDGAVLPILHLNGYKISGPTVLNFAFSPVRFNWIQLQNDRVPMLFQCLIEDINEDLAANHSTYSVDDAAFARFAGSTFLRFERIHPFGDGNGRMGRLLANYFSTYCNRPLLVFPSEYSMRNRYIEAHDSEDAMTTYFHKRMEETNPPSIEEEVKQESPKRKSSPVNISSNETHKKVKSDNVKN